MRTPLIRLAATAMAFWMAILTVASAPFSAVAAQQDEAAQVERVVIDLVRAEMNGDYNLLYDYMAPESRDMVPRQAFVQWYTEEEFPVPTGVPEIGAIDFDDGEYETTGTDYDNIAYVEYSVPVEGDEVDERQLSLVSDGVTWRWFLQLPEEDIDEIAQEEAAFTVDYETLYQTEIYRQLDLFWAQVFADYGAEYRSPIDLVGVYVFPLKVPSFCGGELVEEEFQNNAMYCGIDETIYYDPYFRDRLVEEFGEYAWHFVIAHEWAHHIENLVGQFVTDDPEIYGGVYTIENELQADCLAAIFIQDVSARGLLRNRDRKGIENLATDLLGDPDGTPWDEPGAHGTPEQRVEAFWLGYNDGLRGCYIDIASPGD